MKYRIVFCLKKIRDSKGLTQPQLSKISGISQSYISEIENTLKTPTLDIIERLANALQIHPYEFQEVEIFD
ncbi:helix-turn-helix domain-containing protein [Clostridium botulinum]|uniref:helix-turn-helix domain-containing protein n=1 Tax=Clostridium botulinum TaxID=1491 RepID=UPI000772ECDA|nr:helix-turn-helix transcriptional regulator [Clostridium botulinum]NFN09378.1 helix-turn-helix transcriptional regulator [Clostridium botulinum]NFN32942.1 helix-turn-helix transcriptional regulator [Clostridium botulinum]